MTTPADVPYGSAEVGSKYQGQRGPPPSRYWENFQDARGAPRTRSRSPSWWRWSSPCCGCALDVLDGPPGEHAASWRRCRETTVTPAWTGCADEVVTPLSSWRPRRPYCSTGPERVMTDAAELQAVLALAPRSTAGSSADGPVLPGAPRPSFMAPRRGPPARRRLRRTRALRGPCRPGPARPQRCGRPGMPAAARRGRRGARPADVRLAPARSRPPTGGHRADLSVAPDGGHRPGSPGPSAPEPPHPSGPRLSVGGSRAEAPDGFGLLALASERARSEIPR